MHNHWIFSGREASLQRNLAVREIVVAAMRAITLLVAVVVAFACGDSSTSGSGSQPVVATYELVSEPTAQESAANWNRYRKDYADPELEIASGMVADRAIKSIKLISEYTTKIERVVRLDEESEELWSKDMPRSVHSVRPPAWSRTGNYVFVVQGNGLTALDDKTGDVVWESDGPNDVLFSIGNLIIAGDCSSSPVGGRWAVARHADTGEIVWKVQLSDEVEPTRIMSTGDLIWILSSDMRASTSYLIDQKGNVVAKFDEYVTGVFVVGDEFIFASNTRIARMNVRGDILWQVAHGPETAWPFSTAELAAGPEGDVLVYFYGPISDSGVTVWRLKPQSGEVVWKTRCQSLGVEHSEYYHNVYLRVRQDEVVVVSKGSWMFVEVLSANTGKHLDRFEFQAKRDQ